MVNHCRTTHSGIDCDGRTGGTDPVARRQLTDQRGQAGVERIASGFEAHHRRPPYFARQPSRHGSPARGLKKTKRA